VGCESTKAEFSRLAKSVSNRYKGESEFWPALRLLSPVGHWIAGEISLEAPDNAGKKMKRVVVIAEDSRAKHTVRAVLSNPECEVLETSTIATGLEMMVKESVACVIVDCGITELTREMRHLLQYSAGMAGIPVLWITPYGAREPLARELGISRLNLLPKPFTPLQLLQRVQQSMWIGPYVPAPLVQPAVPV
jgi:response regulator RpfG family c-di-GMP phosphodiesterase